MTDMTRNISRNFQNGPPVSKAEIQLQPLKINEKTVATYMLIFRTVAHDEEVLD